VQMMETVISLIVQVILLALSDSFTQDKYGGDNRQIRRNCHVNGMCSLNADIPSNTRWNPYFNIIKIVHWHFEVFW